MLSWTTYLRNPFVYSQLRYSPTAYLSFLIHIQTSIRSNIVAHTRSRLDSTHSFPTLYTPHILHLPRNAHLTRVVSESLLTRFPSPNLSSTARSPFLRLFLFINVDLLERSCNERSAIAAVATSTEGLSVQRSRFYNRSTNLQGGAQAVFWNRVEIIIQEWYYLQVYTQSTNASFGSFFQADLTRKMPIVVQSQTMTDIKPSVSCVLGPAQHSTTTIESLTFHVTVYVR